MYLSLIVLHQPLLELVWAWETHKLQCSLTVPFPARVLVCLAFQMRFALLVMYVCPSVSNRATPPSVYHFASHSHVLLWPFTFCACLCPRTMCPSIHCYSHHIYLSAHSFCAKLAYSIYTHFLMPLSRMDGIIEIALLQGVGWFSLSIESWCCLFWIICSLTLFKTAFRCLTSVCISLHSFPFFLLFLSFLSGQTNCARLTVVCWFFFWWEVENLPILSTSSQCGISAQPNARVRNDGNESHQRGNDRTTMRRREA